MKLKLDSFHCQRDQSHPVIYRIPNIHGCGHDSPNPDYLHCNVVSWTHVQFRVLRVHYLPLPRKGPMLNGAQTRFIAYLIKMCDSSSCVWLGEETGGGWHFSRCWRHRRQYSCVSLFCFTPTSRVWPSNTNDSQTGSRACMRDWSHFHSLLLSVCPLCRSLSLKLWSLLKSIMHHGPEYKSFLFCFFLTHTL